MKKCVLESCDKESDKIFELMDLHLRGTSYYFCSKDHLIKWKEAFEKRHKL